MQYVNRKEKSPKNSSIFRVSMENNCSTLWVYILSTDLKSLSLSIAGERCRREVQERVLWWLLSADLKKREREEEKTNLLSRVWLFGIPWTVAHQAPLSMGAPGARILVGHHFLFQGIFSTQWFKMGVLAFQAVSLPSEPPRKSRSHFWWGVWGECIECLLKYRTIWPTFERNQENNSFWNGFCFQLNLCQFDG